MPHRLYKDEQIKLIILYLLNELDDTYDFIAVYNGNYDSGMHKFGPESIEALSELRANADAKASAFLLFYESSLT